MAARRYTYACTLTWGGDVPTAEVEVEVSYTVAWGSAESGRFGPPERYDPGSASEVEDIKLLTVSGKPRPWDMGFGFITDNEFEEMVVERLEGSQRDLDCMLEHAGEEAAADHEDYLDRRAEAKREASYGL